MSRRSNRFPYHVQTLKPTIRRGFITKHDAISVSEDSTRVDNTANTPHEAAYEP